MATDRLGGVYQKILDTLTKTIPEKWTKIFLYCEVGEDVGKLSFYYFSDDKEQPVCGDDIIELFDIPEAEYLELWDELLDKLKELWIECQNEGQEAWTNVTIRFDNTGKFKMDCDYTDLSDADDYELQIIWEYKYLGIIPEKPIPKKILEEYLKNNKEKRE